MQTRRLSPVFLACAATFSLLSFQANAQTLNLTNNSSLSKGMTPKAVRTYETNKATKGADGNGVNGQSPDAGGVAGVGTGTGATNNNGTNGGPNGGTNGGPYNGTNIGTNGAGGGTGSSNNSTITGSGGDFMGPPSPNQYNGNGGVTNTGGDFMGPPSPNGLGGLSGAIPGTVVSGGGLATNGQTTPDWLRMIQVAAPVVAGITGNQNVANVASIAGSGAQIYGQYTSGQELTMQNYANMGNIALQASAMATNNTNIDKAAQISNLGTGAWNAYSAFQPATPAANASNGVLAGYSASGQPIYQSTQQAANSGSVPWGAVASIASTTAPQLGYITGNQTLGQVGAVAGLAGNVYTQTNGFNNTPTTAQAAGMVATGASQVGYATGNYQWQQASQVANATGQISNVYNAGNQQQVYQQQPAYQATYQQPQTSQQIMAQQQPAYIGPVETFQTKPLRVTGSDTSNSNSNFGASTTFQTKPYQVPSTNLNDLLDTPKSSSSPSTMGSSINTQPIDAWLY